MKIFGDLKSGNCLKVKYTADYRGFEYEWVDVDIMKGESRTADFLSMNPQGQVPVIRLEDGRVLAQSNAIIRFLAWGSPLLPNDPFIQGKIDQWLFWEQYSHEPYVAVCRFHMLYRQESRESRDPLKVERGEVALDALEHALEEQDWLIGDAMTVADISLVAYTRVAHEGGFDLEPRPRVRQWIARCERELRLRP